jgi:hypothetical protein
MRCCCSTTIRNTGVSARRTHALARLMSDPVGKEAMMEIANNYLAARAVERLAQSTEGRTKPAA